MGLVDVVNQAVAVAFSVVGDFKDQIIFTSKPTSTYDPKTGTVTNPSQISRPVGAIITKAKSHEINGVSVLANDMWALIHSNDITATPKETDEVTFETKIYRIVAVDKIIATGVVLWKIQLRTRK